MLKNAREGIEPDQPGVVGPIKQIEALQKKGFPLAYVGDVVGTGSSRKSATNSVLWFMGDDIPHVPNKRGGGLCRAVRLPQSSSIPWKMRAHCQLKWTSLT